MSRYHKAAIDGYLELLKEATRNDLNARDEDGMTPTLLAAFHGHVDALQLICSRGGDPNKSDIWGNTPLHHAATNGHMHIISFLVNFGANLFALDNEFHTAMDVAASRDRMDCVRFLDSAASQQTVKNAKKVASLKHEATKEAEKRVKMCEKVKKRHQSKMDKMYRGGADDGSVSEASMASSLSSVGGVNEQFSKIIASNKTGSLTARFKGTLQNRFGKKDKGTMLRPGGDGNVIYLKQENGTQAEPEFMGVFNEQDEHESNEIGVRRMTLDDDDSGQTTQSIFNRPGLGGLVFMNTLGLESDDIPSGGNESLGYLVQNEMYDTQGDDTEFQDETEAVLDVFDDEDDEDTSPLETFLSAISLPEFALAFSREQLDLEALMLCSDEDLKDIRIQLGPRKKILEAAKRRKDALQQPGQMKDTSL